MTRKQRWLSLSIALCALFAAVAMFWLRTRQNVEQSIECVNQGTCLPYYGNTRICKHLFFGISERELIHKLGEPIKRVGEWLYFEGGAGELGPIKVKLDGNRNAIQFVCRPNA